MARFRKPLGVLLIAFVAATTIAFAAAPAQAAPRSNAAAIQVEQADGEVGTLATGDCTGHLQRRGYEITDEIFAGCLAGETLARAGQRAAGLATCSVLLLRAGVSVIQTPIACGLAVI